MTNEYGFRFVFTPDMPGDLSMRIDASLAEKSDFQVPLVRFYTWDRPTISVGCNPASGGARRIDLKRCRDDGIPVVRRPTGGRELLHGDDLCYSVIWPTRSNRSFASARAIFQQINSGLALALRSFGLDARENDCSLKRRPRLRRGPCFAQIDSGEISVGGRKLVASAQRVYRNCVLQQGSMALRRPPAEIVEYLVILTSDGHQTVKRRLLKKKIERVATCFHEQVGETIPTESIVERFREAFEMTLGSRAEGGTRLVSEYLSGEVASSCYQYVSA